LIFYLYHCRSFVLEYKRWANIVPGRRGRLFLSLQLSITLFGVACNNRAPDWKEVLKNQPGAAPSPTATSPKTTNELVVYLDTSGSMAGYVSRDGQSIFGKTLRELRYATGTFGDSNAKVLVRRVASAVGPPLTDMELTTASQDQSVYRGGETNLAGAIGSFKSTSQAIVKATGQGESPGGATSGSTDGSGVPARFHLLVTDGVQSTKKGSVTHDCTAGSDQFCVRQKIGELLRDNWGGCVIGLRADFHGKVYSEVSGSSIPYNTSTKDPTSFRPFYLYVFSPDPAALDSLIIALKERLRPLLSNSEPIRQLNLSLPYTNGFADFEMSVSKESRNFVDRIKDRGGPPSRFTVHVDVDTEKAGAKPFSIHAKLPWTSHALDTANEAELAQLLTWTIVPVFPAESVAAHQRSAEIKISGTHVDGPGQITLDATAGFPPGTEKPRWRVYHLQGRLNLNKASPAWIKAWSTDLDTTRNVANRTFNLETALLGLWNTSTTKDQIVAEAYIRIGPK
jgi:hypothetical protein